MKTDMRTRIVFWTTIQFCLGMLVGLNSGQADESEFSSASPRQCDLTVRCETGSSAANCGLYQDSCLPAACDRCPTTNIIAFSGVDSFKGWPDALVSNFGVVNGLNFGTKLPGLGKYGIGGQFGASYGVYDWQGRVLDETDEVQEQIFITTGLFRRATENRPWNVGLAYDFMINNNFGFASHEPFLGQWRGLIGYCLNARNEIGWWGAFSGRDDLQGDTQYRTVTHNNLYWHHNFCNGIDSHVWGGLPENDRLLENGSLYDFDFGGAVTIPVSCRAGLYGNFAYFSPSTSPGDFGLASAEDAWQLGFGINFFLGGSSRNGSVAGRCWAPLLPTANNGNMVVDFDGFVT